jgi:hypothetical protein
MAFAAIGELQTDLEGILLGEHASSHLGRGIFVEAGGARPDAASHEEFESPA